VIHPTKPFAPPRPLRAGPRGVARGRRRGIHRQGAGKEAKAKEPRRLLLKGKGAVPPLKLDCNTRMGGNILIEKAISVERINLYRSVRTNNPLTVKRTHGGVGPPQSRKTYTLKALEYQGRPDGTAEGKYKPKTREILHI